MKAISLFFYCLLIFVMFVMAGCASNHSMDEQPLEKKTVKNTKKKKDLPPPVIQVVQAADRLRVIAYSDGCFRPAMIFMIPELRPRLHRIKQR